MPIELEQPPLTRNPNGEVRRVGVEIEFAGLEVAKAAELVVGMFGGRALEVDEHRFRVEGTTIGDFTVELDSMYAHPDDNGLTDKLGDKMKDKVAGTVGDIVGLWLPNEIVAPPLAYHRLPELDRLIGLLKENRAEGTQASIFYGFGLQLNPEVAQYDPAYLLRHLQAYLIMSPWLREQIQIDATRRALPFTDPFPAEYVRTALAPDYAPDLGGLIEDYVAANPSRNRELDLMPLFMELAPEVVGRLVDDPHIKARPTFHYRLPNARIGDESWGGIIEEWNRWVAVERLAEDRPRLEEARAEVHGRLEREAKEGWLDWLGTWLPGRSG
jgi:hypothetical protein